MASRPSFPSGRGCITTLTLSLCLAACGGGGGGDGGGSAADMPGSCTVADQQSWLGGYMNDWYFWYRLSPRPDASTLSSVDSYFAALLYTGTDARFPADRWSRSESTASFNLFFGDGATLGYGISVNGLEAPSDPAKRLWVRYVEPASPAGLQGVQRGDEIVSINGRSAASLVTANDYSVLSAAAAGETVTLAMRRAGADRTVTLAAAVFNLTPVQGASVSTTPLGRRMAYLMVKDMVSQALAPLDTAFAQFKAAGVNDLVLDLRYNGGGLVSTGATVASYVAGTRAVGLNYATLLYNDQHAASNNVSVPFAAPGAALALPRVFVLTGPRTCSASEQVVNGLRGAGITVVTVGDTTCGKPVGFLPSSYCSRTYSVVNFESVNQRNEGRYFDGFAANCRVAEDFSAPAGSLADPLMAAARTYADTGACPVTAVGQATALAVRRSAVRPLVTDERQGMLDR
jgi:hypothetical protein